MKPNHKIAGIGEILWDMFPGEGRLGGAPSNFACHCHQLGSDAFPVSCVGDDELGLQTQKELERLGVSSEFVEQNPDYPTGRVQVSLDEAGKPSYEILDDMAWDHLEFTPEMQALAETLDAACFGILSQRSPGSRNTIQRFLRAMPEDSLRIFDVNLRGHFYSIQQVEVSLRIATILKLSDEELPILADYFDLSGSVTDQLAKLREKFELDLVAYTRGRAGSLLIGEREINESVGLEVTARDSVGAGDSFTAALCTGLLKGMRLSEVNAFANRVASFVCSQKGACPKLPDSLKWQKVGP
ncbi:MAG: carbohydrate kinase [Verrucomicrobiales bacterium]|nr:carbohydrate kinase [Verrucomicrobiales bacterium]